MSVKPALEYLPRESGESFVVKDFDYKYYPTPWHYHPEYEIVMVTESTGKRFIGDHISDFAPDNLAMIGPNIPHTYKNEEKYYEEKSKLRAKSIVVHFTEDVIGKSTLDLPEMQKIKRLFENAQWGLEVTGETFAGTSKKLYEIVKLSGVKRWLCLIEMLIILSESKTLKPITKWGETGYNEKEQKRLWDVFDWVASNYENKITLAEAAHIAGMNQNAFSRYFSQRTRKPFSAFVQELRLQKAARLIIENDELSVTQICYECGYNNLSNFNRQFLNFYKMSPSRYKRSFQ